MTAATWSRVSNDHKIVSIGCAIVLASMAIAYEGGRISHAPTITHTQTIQIAPSSGAGVAKAWGAPDQEVAGEQLSSSLSGLTCGVWQTRHAIVCYPA